MTDRTTRHLFQRFPGLVGKIPWMPMADLPTLVERLDTLGARLGVRELWVKRDDLDSKIYSGNKARKFEFIFAEARDMGRRAVMTMGSHGSNHGVATSLYCRHYGFEPILMLSPQPVLSYVRANILVNAALRARMIHGANSAVSVLQMIGLTIAERLRGRTPPYFIYFGGSSRAGNVGFVEAGLELAEQIRIGEMPAPRYIFVATGSCGTHAGLAVGLKLAGLPTQVIGVRIVPKSVTNRHVVALHANRVARYLRRLDPSVPEVKTRPSDIVLLDDFFGGLYGRPTAEGKEAIRLARETEGLALDPTYTGKTFAGLIDFVRRNGSSSEPILYWQTLNSVDIGRYCAGASPEALPAKLRCYFTEPLYDPDL